MMTTRLKLRDRIKAAATVLDEIQGTPDRGIPEEVLGMPNV